MIIFFLCLFLSLARASEATSCATSFDQLDIPHVRASSLEEFYYCFGLHHGSDRAWEMDFFRRVGEGRNSEILGYRHLKSDLMMRLLDLPSLAEKLWSDFSPDKKKWIQLYAQGVNKGFETGRRSQEFKDKDYAPEPWKPQHTILVLLLQSFDQTRKTFSRDYEEELTRSKWEKAALDLFDEDGLPWENTILKPGEYVSAKPQVKTSLAPPRPLDWWGDFPFVFGRESGSNNWAVSAKRSKTRHAILANDPHLDLKTPMFWYWISLKAPGLSVVGASVPGVPVIASGTNGKVAWGLTNSYINSADAVFLKDVKDEDIETIRPTVYIKLWGLQIPFFFKTFERLKSGHPILPLETESSDRIGLRWSGFSLVAEDIYPMFDFFQVKSVGEMESLLSKVGLPSWNFVFADSSGHIGYRLVGKTYRNLVKTPLGIPMMTMREFLNVSYLAPSERPHVLKPRRGYVYSANNRHWPSDSKFYGGRGYSHSFRGLRIDETLSRDKHDLESFRKLQCDRQVVDARFFLPKLQRLLNLPEFAGWDLLGSDDSKQLPLYRRLMDIAMEEWKVNEYALFKLLDRLDEARMRELGEFVTLAREDVKGRSWGEIHRLNFPHMSKDDSWSFAPDIAGPGDTHSVDPGTAKWSSDKQIYQQESGASMRMIVELNKVPRIWLALPGVNRGYDQRPNPAPWQGWKNCTYHEVKF